METDDRVAGAWWGPWVADALAMPAHWYYQRELIPRDYGSLETFAAPREPHPDSILWRSEHRATGPRDEILHDQKAFWGLRGAHYHRSLAQGENTLNLKLAALLAESLRDCNGYDQDDYVRRYLDFFLTPGRHRDTYIEECHRGFFRNYAKGVPPHKCGINDEHIGGLATIVPLILHYCDDTTAMRRVIHTHVSLTHRNPDVLAAADAFAVLLSGALAGEPLPEVMRRCGPAVHPAFSLPFTRWAATRDETSIIGSKFSPACYIEDAFPASLFLAVKYEGRFCDGVRANVFLGGDSCHRGVVVGALLGAAGGASSIPDAWIAGLHGCGTLASLAPRPSATI